MRLRRPGQRARRERAMKPRSPRGALRVLLLALILLATGEGAPAATDPPAPSGLPIRLMAEDASPRTIPWVRQLAVRAARLRGVPRVEPVDGLDSTRVSVAEAVEIELIRSAHVGYAELDGSGRVCLRSPEGEWTPEHHPDGARLRIDAQTKQRRLTVAAVDAPVSLAEVRLYQVDEAPLPEESTPLALTPQPPQESAAWAWKSAPLSAGQGITAAVLELDLDTPLPPALRVRLECASEPGRAWLQVDLKLVAPAEARRARLSLLLDPPDVWCEAGDALLLSLSPLPAGAPPLRPSPVRLRLVGGTAETVRDEFALARLNWFGAWYAANLAAAPWEQPGWQPEREPAVRWLRALRAWYPHHPGVIAYAARVLGPRQEVRAVAPGPENAPAWARLACQLLKRHQSIAYWWRSTRQQPDGLFGGDPGSDALLLETLSAVPLITGDALAWRSLESGIETAWRLGTDEATGAGEEIGRWSRRVAATQPLLLLSRPGSPLALERCLIAAERLRRWTAVNARGHRHFLSTRLSGDGTRPDPDLPVDAPGNALAAGPAFAVAWQSGNPTARRLLLEWASAWLEAAREADADAPVRAVDARSCQVLPADPTAREADALLRRLFLDAHQLSGDAAFLMPVSRAIAAGGADPLATALWRAVGTTGHDDALTQAARADDGLRAYAAWQATRNKQFVTDALQLACARILADHFLLTEAHPPTDHLAIPGHLLLRFLYLGGPATWRGGLPRLAVTWEESGADFAAFVVENESDRLKVLAYHFQPAERAVRLRIWGLRPGTYQLATGCDDDYDDSPEGDVSRREVELHPGDALPLVLPAQRPFVISLKARKLRPAGDYPDLALDAAAVSLAPDRRALTVKLHNLGAAPATGITLTVTDDRRQPLGTATVPRLAWPEDLQPATLEMTVALARPATPRFRVSVACAEPEVMQCNNSVVLSAP